jgi:hypothetical protein
VPFVLIPTAWLAVVLFALILCRLAALSDAFHDVALAEWIATTERIDVSSLAEHRGVLADGHGEQLPLDRQRGVDRATG